MVRVNPQEQLIRLLTAKLKSHGLAKSGNLVPQRGMPPMRRARALLGTQSLSDHEASHILLSGILADQFGPRVASDPQFQSMLDKIYAQISEDPDARVLLQATLAQLRNAE